MRSRRKPKPARAKERVEPHFGGRKPQARKSAPLPPPPVFYRRWRGRHDIKIDAPFFHLHLKGNR